MPNFLTGLELDDVLLEPCYSPFLSRFSGEIDLSTELLPGVKLRVPIISANMDTVTGVALANVMYEGGGLGIIHRFDDLVIQANKLQQQKGPVIVCIGTGDEAKKRMDHFAKELDNYAGILVDIAHGHSAPMVEMIKWLAREYNEVPVIAGNIGTTWAARELIDLGVDCLKCGVGPGFSCRTQANTGAGVPQLTAILNVREGITRAFNEGLKRRVTLIADGGIKSGGCITKCLAAGADAVMIGKLFAGTNESCGKKYLQEGKALYRGMSSFEAMTEWKGQVTSVEGICTCVPLQGPTKEVLERLVANVLSGFSYLGASNVKELRENATFIVRSKRD